MNTDEEMNKVISHTDSIFLFTIKESQNLINGKTVFAKGEAGQPALVFLPYSCHTPPQRLGQQVKGI